MWYKNKTRRHLCDMHIDDWDDKFLSCFSPEEYLGNLKTAKIQSAMLYFQSHVGLCYYPTKTGRIHNSFKGREDAMKKLCEMCHENDIAVTGYYSLIYNNWAHDNYHEWRMVGLDGKSLLEKNETISSEFAKNDVLRYGLCCPNNLEYRNFISEQIKEIADYFKFDGMFFDMLFWPHFCYCDSCKERWKKEVGGELPTKEDWNDSRWLLFMSKRREWIGEFAKFATDTLKAVAPNSSVEHNCAYAVLPGNQCLAESVLNASDYAGGDLYGGIYRQSFTCKFYKNITKNQPFEYMFSRCTPSLSKHTVTKSKDEMRSEVFLTTAHHGATLVIDAIDPIGTMDNRVYKRVGEVFDEVIPYDKYLVGDMIEDFGIYYTLKSKFNAHGEVYTNHMCAVNTADTLIYNNISFGVTGGYDDLSKYKVIIASCLTEQDSCDNEKIIDYVLDGGHFYFSGGDNSGLLKTFFNAECTGRTQERIVYISPKKIIEKEFDYFNNKYPMHFDGTSPIVSNIDTQDVIATITLPYTNQDSAKFVSIHSNPPGIPTNIPAIAYKKFGRGSVIWSALPFECVEMYDYRRIFISLLTSIFTNDLSVTSDAPKDVEIICFESEEFLTVSAVVLNMDYKARKVEKFTVNVRCKNHPKRVVLMPNNESIDFQYNNGVVSFDVENIDIFKMFKIEL